MCVFLCVRVFVCGTVASKRMNGFWFFLFCLNDSFLGRVLATFQVRVPYSKIKKINDDFQNRPNFEKVLRNEEIYLKVFLDVFKCQLKFRIKKIWRGFFKFCKFLFYLNKLTSKPNFEIPDKYILYDIHIHYFSIIHHII